MTTAERLIQGLSDEQRQAVLETEGPTLILAGAGSGKTRVITHRIAYLIESGRAKPHEILAVTFTNKAAGEMRDRVVDLVGGFLGDLWISTFHSLGARLLRMHADRVGLSSSFSIYDEDDTTSALKTVIKELGFDPKRVTPERARSYVDAVKFAAVNPELGGTPPAEAGDPVLRRVFDGYLQRLRGNNAVDFDDLLTLTVRLFLDAPDLRARYAERFRYLLVDEYQDTNRVQYHLCRMLAAHHRNICVVGDEDQSIYSWRGADIRNILDFERDYPSTRTYHLVQNYRSTDVILAAAAALISHNKERRKEHELWTTKTGGAPIDYRHHLDGRQEASSIVSTMQDMMRTGVKAADMAVFYRLHAQSRAVEQELVRRRIPYRIYGGTRFFERKEVKDVLAYLRVFANPLDEVSLTRVVNVPPRRIGATTVSRAASAARDRDLPLYAFLELGEAEGIPRAAAGRLQSFHAFLEAWRERFDALGAGDALTPLVRDFLDDLGYVDHLTGSGRDDRVELVQELLAMVAEHDEGRHQRLDDERPLVSFLNQATLATDQDTEGGPGDVVTLMTLHNAKGLEFPVAFLIGLDEGMLPYTTSTEGEERLEEERRLCYVGITRAMRRLHLSSAQQRFIWGRLVPCIQSRFLREAGILRVAPGKDDDGVQDFPDEEFADPFWDD